MNQIILAEKLLYLFIFNVFELESMVEVYLLNAGVWAEET